MVFVEWSAASLIIRTPKGTPFRGQEFDAGGAPPLDFPTADTGLAITRRRALPRELERPLSRSTSGDSYNPFRERAFDLLVSPQVRRAFDLEREPARTRQHYDHHICGQSALLARRLIEVACRL